MATNAIVTKELGPSAEAIEKVLVGGDLSPLTTEQRISYYNAVCKSVGLNPLTRPFDYIKLNSKLVLYAKRDATDQLRNNHHVSITGLHKEQMGDLFIVTASANCGGRTDTATGAVSVKGLSGEALANAFMKAETKAKRRVTLSICGLGLLDETETGDVIDVDPDVPTVQQPQRASAPAPMPKALPQAPADAKGEYITNDQRREFIKTCLDAGWSNEQVKQLLSEKFGIDSTAKIPVARYQEIARQFASSSMDPQYAQPEIPFKAQDEDIPF